MDKYLCFRFDVDTHLCMGKGVENILQIAETYDARCTLFVNMGRAFKRSYFIGEKFFSSRDSQPMKGTFPMQYKLGWAHSFEALVRNPKVGASHGNLLKLASDKGHEIGLHGGKNHAVWEQQVLLWNEKRLRQEIEYGLKFFNDFQLPAPISFASPCWKTPDKLPEVLTQKGFLILADENDPKASFKKDALGLLHYPLSVAAQRQDVGFIENFKALGYSSEAILAEFEKQLDQPGRYKMVFDHPLYAAIHEPSLLSAMMLRATEKGYRLESLKNTLPKIK